MSKTLRSKRRAAAKKCEELNISVGDRISIRGGNVVTVTAIGMCSILVKPSRGEEKQIKEPSEIHNKYELLTMGLTFTSL